MRFYFGIIAVAVVTSFWWWSTGEVRHGPGIVAPDAPVQEPIVEAEVLRRGDFLIIPQARFEIEARVLGKERYWLGREARLSPMDLSLGWGRMSDESVLEAFSISQSRRFYFWMSDDLPIARAEVIHQSANIHVVPYDEEVEDVLDEVRPGHVVQLSGYLVNVSGSGGWRWTTSMRRDDTGNGSCELLLVREASIVR